MSKLGDIKDMSMVGSSIAQVPEDYLTEEDLRALADALEKTQPLQPTNDTPPEDFLEKERDYVTLARGPRDVVLSGPVVNGWGPGRYFMNRKQARAWCEEKYGKERVGGNLGYTRGRWSFVIRGLAKVQQGLKNGV